MELEINEVISSQCFLFLNIEKVKKNKGPDMQ